jgi:hypothetical protein
MNSAPFARSVKMPKVPIEAAAAVRTNLRLLIFDTGNFLPKSSRLRFGLDPQNSIGPSTFD